MSILDHAPPCPDCGTTLSTAEGVDGTYVECVGCGWCEDSMPEPTWAGFAEYWPPIAVLVAEVRRLEGLLGERDDGSDHGG